MINNVQYSDPKEKFFLVSLSQIKGIGSIILKRMIKLYESAENIYDQKFKDLCRISGVGPIIAKEIKNKNSHFKTEKILNNCENLKISVLTISDDNYPHRLKNIPESPPVLFFKGNLNSLNNKKVLSIVGTRECTRYGRNFISSSMKALFSKDITIVSGLAKGIDYCSHQESLKHSMRTIGVLPCPIDEIYPLGHYKLAEQMLENGGLLSEYSPLIKNEKYCFPARNKIIAGVSDATLVIEAGKRSGALLTAQYATKYNKKVFAVPGDIDKDKSKGCNALIKNKLAYTVTCVEDMLSYLKWKSPENTNTKSKINNFELPKKEQEIMNTLNQYGSEGVKIKVLRDLLSKNFEYHERELNSCLSKFEMKNWIEKLPGNRVSLCFSN